MSTDRAADRIVLRHRVTGRDPKRAVELLAVRTGLSRRALKGAMSKGAVWIRDDRGRRRIRRGSASVRTGDRVELYYDARVLAMEPPEVRCMLERARCSVWLKPAGLLAQGSDYGDHCSLLRQVQRSHAGARLVHRLDRETVGLMLLAHDRTAAAALSQLFRQGQVAKRYRAVVLGEVAPGRGSLEGAIDGKAARTDFEVRAVHRATGRTVSELDLSLVTGRTHQIRRHLAESGHPVLGDPRYGRGNKNRDGLQLAAFALGWVCPFSGERIDVALDPRGLLGPGVAASDGRRARSSLHVDPHRVGHGDGGQGNAR